MENYSNEFNYYSLIGLFLVLPCLSFLELVLRCVFFEFYKFVCFLCDKKTLVCF